MLRSTALFAFILCADLAVQPAYSGPAPNAAPAMLEDARRSGDMPRERAHAWEVFARLTAAGPAFETWHGEAQVFGEPASSKLPLGIAGFSREGVVSASFASSAEQSAEAPVFTYTLYNDPAFQHIQSQKLNRIARLADLRDHGAADDRIAGDRAIPAFPETAIIIKTVWWPVAGDRATILPVWDPENNPPLRAGNGYLSWNRVLRVQPAGTQNAPPAPAGADFGGRHFDTVAARNVDAFYYIRVERNLADRAMRDPMTRNLVLLALGRELRPGDMLLLVGANIATRELKNWIWIALWWHDRAGEGPFAAGRPSDISGVWRNYLMSTTFDSDLPAASDGGPNICFNPWLEGRFPDRGQGGGVVSNCMSCHQRASFPAVNFLPVRRGGAVAPDDEVYAADRLRTSLLWMLPLHASQ